MAGQAAEPEGGSEGSHSPASPVAGLLRHLSLPPPNPFEIARPWEVLAAPQMVPMPSTAEAPTDHRDFDFYQGAAQREALRQLALLQQLKAHVAAGATAPEASACSSLGSARVKAEPMPGARRWRLLCRPATRAPAPCTPPPPCPHPAVPTLQPPPSTCTPSTR